MEKCISHSSISIEKSKKSTNLRENDEVANEFVTEMEFQYVSLKKMNYVQWAVKRKIQKEKEQLIWLDYALRLPECEEVSEHSLHNYEAKLNEEKRHTTKCQQIIDKRSEKSLRNMEHLYCQRVVKNEYQNHCQILKPNSYTDRKLRKNEATGDTKTPVQTRLANTSSHVKFGNDKQQLQSVQVGSRNFSASYLENFKLRTSLPNKNKVMPLNNSKPKSSNKSSAFSSLCSHIWQRLLTNEEEEKRLYIHLQDINKELSENICSRTEMKNGTVESKPAALPRKLRLNEPVAQTLHIKPTLKLYDVCDKSLLVKRLSDAIVDDLLNQVCKEFNKLSEIFLYELFENEFLPSKIKNSGTNMDYVTY